MKKSISPNISQIIVRDIKGRFAKINGRKKQTVYIRNLETNEIKKIHGKVTKKEYKKLKKQVDSIFKRKLKTFRNKRLEIVIPVIKHKKIDIVVSKRYKLKEETGYNRVETIIESSMYDFGDNFSGAFQYARESKAYLIVVSVKLIIKLRGHAKFFDGEFFINAERYSVELRQDTIESYINKLKNKIRERLKLFSSESKAKEYKIKMYIKFVYKDEK